MLFPIAVFASNASLTNIRVIQIEHATRIIFSLTQSTDQHTFALTNPDRIVVDFTDVKLKEYLKNLKFPTAQVSSIRAGYPKPHTLRLVFNVSSPVNFKLISALQNKRFILDIARGSQPIATVTAKALTKAPVKQEVKKRDFIVVIDAGHGGKDPGAIGIKGIQEKNVALSIAKRLADLVNAQSNMQAVLTRNGDYFVELADRLKLARKGKADIFISIHADSYFNNQATGASVYVLSERGASTVAAKWLAQHENHSELGGVDLNQLPDQSHVLRSILIDLAQTATATNSLRLGTAVLDGLEDMTLLRYSRVEKAPFMVLKSPDIPSILIETGYISNPTEEARLHDANYQNKLALSIFNGIKTYIKKYS